MLLSVTARLILEAIGQGWRLKVYDDERLPCFLVDSEPKAIDANLRKYGDLPRVLRLPIGPFPLRIVREVLGSGHLCVMASVRVGHRLGTSEYRGLRDKEGVKYYACRQ